ncbi:hypothetical protein WJX72_004336 [[Myrmecia] bisecta]|uniref:PWWP domain-containing protein n=1 Tax=[Myrmecia] bisecta TaxID=41462 RepID=A0AAW1QQB6_9CHLO
MAGSVVWAKLARYPWWPAQVLAERDPYIPEGSEPPRRGAVPVRFFGTYEFSWIESQRALTTFDRDFNERSQKSRAPEFVAAVEEAVKCQETGELPEGFELALQLPDDVGPQLKAQRAKKGAGKGKAGKRGAADAAQAAPLRNDPYAQERAKHLALASRKDRMMNILALAPPHGSPFAEGPCLAGVEQLVRQMRQQHYHQAAV